MILPDHEIEKLAIAGMIRPFNIEHLNPASYDLTVGDSFVRQILRPITVDLLSGFSNTTLHNADQSGRIIEQVETLDGPILLLPGDFILIATLERFYLPNDIIGQFSLKSSIARKGLSHNMAGWCDPGWHDSVLTMELVNVTKNKTITLEPGQRIGQMSFAKLLSPCLKNYSITGRYNNDRTVMPEKK